jgi:DNA-binding ferritin-like protein
VDLKRTAELAGVQLNEDHVLLEAAGDKKINDMINHAMFMTVQSHFWHWETKSHAAHVALGTFYEDLNTSMDACAEAFMGSGGTVSQDCNKDFVKFSDSAAKSKLNEFKKVLQPLSTHKNQSVADNVIDMIKQVDALLYQLTLK